MCTRGKKCYFSENFAHVLNWMLRRSSQHFRRCKEVLKIFWNYFFQQELLFIRNLYEININIQLFYVLFSNGTSMISLIIPPKDQISRVAKMLADEFGTASNIKSRVNRYDLEQLHFFLRVILILVFRRIEEKS